MKTIISILAILVTVNCAFGTAYLIEDGDFFGALSLHDYDTLLMTGGGDRFKFVRLQQCGYRRNGSFDK